MKTAITAALSRHSIDARQVWALTTVYIKLDLRSSKSAAQLNSGQPVMSNRALVLTFVMYLVLGMSVGMLAFTRVDVLSFSMVALSYTLFIVALSLVAESGNVLFNESEIEILGHLPISPRTLFTAKVVNLVLYTLLVATASSLAPAITGIWASGSSILFPIAHAVSTVMISMFATVLLILSYGLLTRYVSKERFDNLVTYSQVALTLLFMLGFQLLPRIIDLQRMQAEAGVRWYHLLYPPAWFAGVTMLLIGRLEIGQLALAALAILFLFTLGTVAFRKLSLDYTFFISGLAFKPARLESGPEQRAGSARAKKKSGLFAEVKARLLSDPVEAAVFDLVKTYLKRNREVKVRIYPSLASFIFFPIMGYFSESLHDPFTDTGPYVFGLLSAEMVCFVAITVIEGLMFSEHYQAGYIFRVAPVTPLRRVHAGFRKAVLLYVALPGFAVMFALIAVLWRNPIHALLVVAPWVALAPAVLTLPFIAREALPLARKYQKGQQSARNFFWIMATFVGLSFFLGLQALALNDIFPYWVFILCLFAAAPLFYLIGLKLSGELKKDGG
jgi:ABC-2 type transport system permease protein